MMGLDNKWKYCVVGNVKKTHYDENDNQRYGTRSFAGGKKVYLCGRYLKERLPCENRERISVLGICRGGRYYVDYIPVNLIENVRLSKTYKPRVLEIMSDWEFEDGWWGNTPEDKQDAEEFVKKWNEMYEG